MKSQKNVSVKNVSGKNVKNVRKSKSEKRIARKTPEYRHIDAKITKKYSANPLSARIGSTRQVVIAFIGASKTPVTIPEIVAATGTSGMFRKYLKRQVEKNVLKRIEANGEIRFTRGKNYGK